jgi:hypothetical protein
MVEDVRRDECMPSPSGSTEPTVSKADRVDGLEVRDEEVFAHDDAVFTTDGWAKGEVVGRTMLTAWYRRSFDGWDAAALVSYIPDVDETLVVVSGDVPSVRLCG